MRGKPTEGPWLAPLREICLALPDASEDDQGVGDPGFKVRSKVFAMQHGADPTDTSRGHGPSPSLWCKTRPGLREVLIGSRPEAFFVPPYVGVHGWVGLWLDGDLDWSEVADLIEDSYRLSASRRQLAQLDAGRPGSG
jgi:predicted DNA-binding protein (MmcQ/YjbR family)